MYMKDEKIVEIDDYRLELEKQDSQSPLDYQRGLHVKYESRRFPVSALKSNRSV